VARIICHALKTLPQVALAASQASSAPAYFCFLPHCFRLQSLSKEADAGTVGAGRIEHSSPFGGFLLLRHHSTLAPAGKRLPTPIPGVGVNTYALTHF